MIFRDEFSRGFEKIFRIEFWRNPKFAKNCIFDPYIFLISKPENRHEIGTQGSKNRFDYMDLDIFDSRNRILRSNMAPDSEI